ncbi:hypothetical protein HMPREF1988_00520 [Porphyromonas gingivalis F0185]|nr:hypothetical protein HMPREF1988_00520 [Porphyromonas gingivalis F0185]
MKYKEAPAQFMAEPSGCLMHLIYYGSIIPILFVAEIHAFEEAIYGARMSSAQSAGQIKRKSKVRIHV